MTCAFADPGWVHVQLTFELDYDNPPADMAMRVVKGMAAAVAETNLKAWSSYFSSSSLFASSSLFSFSVTGLTLMGSCFSCS
jgi:hypothetical protein